MRNIYLILFAFVSLSMSAQNAIITPQGAVNRVNRYLGGEIQDSIFVLPINTTNVYPNIPLKGRVRVNADTNLLEYHNGTTWVSSVIGITGDVIDNSDPLNPVVNLGYSMPELYGAIANDTIDDTAAIVACLAVNDRVAFTRGEYIASYIEVSEGKTLFGYGESTSIKTVSDTTLIKIIGANVTIENLTLVGSGKDSGLLSQIGIWRDRGPSSQSERQNVKITNCNFYNFGYAGYYSTRHRGLNYMGGTLLTTCFARGNNVGFFCALQGEYNSFVNCQASENNDGVYIIGGNNNWVGGQLTGNNNNFRLGTGLNDGHCTIEGVKINHGVNYNILADDVINGYRFTNCDIYNSQVRIDGCTNIRFDNCEFGWTGLQAEELYVLTSTVRFQNCWFIKTPVTYSLTGSTIEWLENKWLQTPIPGITQYTLASASASQTYDTTLNAGTYPGWSTGQSFLTTYAVGASVPAGTTSASTLTSPNLFKVVYDDPLSGTLDHLETIVNAGTINITNWNNGSIIAGFNLQPNPARVSASPHNLFGPSTGETIASEEFANAKIAQTVTNGVTASAPSQDAVFDAIAAIQTAYPETTYAEALVWNGTPPSGTLTGYWRGVKTGKLVTLFINLTYSVPGASNSTLEIPLPTGAPLPSSITGFTGANSFIVVGSGTMATSVTSSGIAGRVVMRKVGAGYTIFNTVASGGAYNTAMVTIQYMTD